MQKFWKQIKQRLDEVWAESRTGPYFVTTLAILLGGLMIYFGVKFAGEVDPTPCSKDGFPGRCYEVNQTVCQAVWNKSEDFCNDRIRKMTLAPTQLTGPIRSKCQVSILDQNFVYNRINTSECRALHEDLEGWRKRNPDFNP